MSSGRKAKYLWMVLGGLAIPANAMASGLDAPIVGSGQSGPVTVDAAGIYWNPGALGAIDSFEVFAGAGLVAGRVGVQRERRGTYASPDVFRYPSPLFTDPNEPRKM